jgi:hypothetical protein
MIKRQLGRGPLVASAALLFCCGTILAEEGPILPGLDAIPQSPPYAAHPLDTDRPAKSRRAPRPASPVLERERSDQEIPTNRPTRRDETPPATVAPNANRLGARGLFPQKPADQAPLTRSAPKTNPDRTRSPGRAPEVAPNPRDTPPLGRGKSDPRALDRASSGERRAPLVDPWSAGRQQTDARPRAALEQEKAWRTGKSASPAANALAPRASSAVPPKSPPRTAPLGRQSSKTPPASSRAGQPSGSGLAR